MSSRTEKSIIKNIFKLASGEGIGRIIGFAVAPIITRIYSPSDIGVLAVYSSLLAMITPFATLRYPLAIPICRNEKLAVNLMAACLLILIIGTTLIYIIFGTFGAKLLDVINMAALTNYWYLLPIGFLFTGFYNILNQYAIRKKKMSALAKASIIQKFTGSLVKILLGLLSFKPVGLLLGDIMTQSGGITVLLKSFWIDLRKRIKEISFIKIRYTLRRYIKFPIYRVPQQILLAAASSLPIMFFAFQFDAKTTGQIGLARTMLSVPVTFMGYAVGKAYFAEIANLNRNSNEIYSLTLSVIRKLFLLSFIPFGLVIVFGPQLFEIIFGIEWHDSGIYARLFSIFLIFQFIYSPISEGIFNVFEKQSKVLLLECFRFLIILTVLGISYYFRLSPSYTLLSYSLGLALQYIISLVVVYNIIRP